MSIYAKINSDNIVENTIECNDNIISEMSGKYIKVIEETKQASIGYTFDPESVKFIAPKPFESWILNASHDWESPTGDKMVLGKIWDEETQVWVLYSTE